MQITVAAFEEPLLSMITSLGYCHPEGIWKDHRPPGLDGPDSDGQKLFYRPPAGQRPTNTHVRIIGRPNKRYPFLFRDYLRDSPKSTAAYARLKQKLAQHLVTSQSYNVLKDPAVDLTYFAAEDWAKSTGWKIRPSDT